MSDQDWLDYQEGLASHQLEHEAFTREHQGNFTPETVWVTDEDGRQIAFRDRAAAVRFAHAILAEVEIAQRAEQEYDERGCECEIDWNCPLHQGGPTATERQNDAWASEQTEIDRQHGM